MSVPVAILLFLMNWLQSQTLPLIFFSFCWAFCIFLLYPYTLEKRRWILVYPIGDYFASYEPFLKRSSEKQLAKYFIASTLGMLAAEGLSVGLWFWFHTTYFLVIPMLILYAVFYGITLFFNFYLVTTEWVDVQHRKIMSNFRKRPQKAA